MESIGICRTCGEPSVIKVAEKAGIMFFSCCNEKCNNYAELLVLTPFGMESVSNMIESYKKVIDEITCEKNKVSES